MNGQAVVTIYDHSSGLLTFNGDMMFNYYDRDVGEINAFYEKT
jgi:hypothetical protein